MVKLKQEYKDNSIPVSELKDGQIGVITEWTNNYYIKTIIQKNQFVLIVIGGKCGDGWGKIPTSEDCRVRILEDGTELIITNNQ